MTGTDWLQQLIDRRAYFLRFVTERLGDRTDAEDLIQGVYTRLIADPPAQPDQPSAWFHRVLKNAVSDLGRRTATRSRRQERLEGVERAETEAVVVSRTPCRCVLSVLEAMPKASEALIRRADIEGTSIVQIARDLNIKPGTARVRLLRARRTLRERLGETCHACAEAGCTDCDCHAGAHGPRATLEAPAIRLTDPVNPLL